jgi:hypothetical protein
MTTGSSWPYVDPFPGQYEAPNGVESTIPSANVEALRDPSAATIPEAVANAYAQSAAVESTTHGHGSIIGAPIALPTD